jgi:hypothetical protein
MKLAFSYDTRDKRSTPSLLSPERRWFETIFMVPWMAASRLFRLRRPHALGRMPREVATALLEGNQDPRAPTTNGSVGPRCPYLVTLRSYPAWRDSGVSNGTVNSMIIWGVAEVTTTSGRRVVPGNSRLIRTLAGLTDDVGKLLQD